MTFAHDLFAESNPAYCAIALAWYASGYSSVRPRGPELPTSYLMMPLALSGDLAKTFEATSSTTGLLLWVERNPQVLVGIKDRVDSAAAIVTAAVRFGFFSKLLVLEQGARFRAGPKKLWNSNTVKEDPLVLEVFKRSERMGKWFAGMGSTRAIFDALDVTV